MPSLKTKYTFILNFAVAVVVLCIYQVPTYANDFPEDKSLRQIDYERVLIINLLLCKRNMDYFAGNNIERLYQAPWMANNVVTDASDIQPRSTKRNLEYLAKSSGGYLKRIQTSDKVEDKKDDVSPIAKVIRESLGKQKKGLYTLAKNGDFPQKNLKPNVKEVAVGTYKFVQKSLDFKDFSI